MRTLAQRARPQTYGSTDTHSGRSGGITILQFRCRRVRKPFGSNGLHAMLRQAGRPAHPRSRSLASKFRPSGALLRSSNGSTCTITPPTLSASSRTAYFTAADTACAACGSSRHSVGVQPPYSVEIPHDNPQRGRSVDRRRRALQPATSAVRRCRSLLRRRAALPVVARALYCRRVVHPSHPLPCRLSRSTTSCNPRSARHTRSDVSSVGVA